MKTLGLGPKGHRYRVIDPGGGGKLAKAWRSGVPYEATVCEDMASLRLSGVAVDAGANVGNHSLWLAVVCGLEVEAFEPIRVDALTANVALNHLEDRIRIHPHALGAESGMASVVGKGRLDPEGGDEIVVKTLDSFGFVGVSLLKVDVEGMDAEVIEGGLETIARSRPVVYAEAWDDDYRARIDALLTPLGYTHTKSFRWNQNRWTP